MKRMVLALLATVLLAASCSGGPTPIKLGAVYPMTGDQGPGGGLNEFRGVKLAVDLTNSDGGVDGRTVDLESLDVTDADAAPGAVDALQEKGVQIVLGSYGSTISMPAADEAARNGQLFWETGAVGDMTGRGSGEHVFRVAPTGGSLGHSAISFVADQLAPLHHRTPESMRWAVANVDDVYGGSVADGALSELRSRHLRLAGEFPYDPDTADFAALAHKIAGAKPDVLFVSAYMDDGVELAHQLAVQHVPLVVSIGTSSSYCMPYFGKDLGEEAVGLFASDKPDADAINPGGLLPEARALLARANDAYVKEYHEPMEAPALAGFSGAWALLHHVMPNAAGDSPDQVATAARAANLPEGSLPNGSGLHFGAPGTSEAGANLNAESVIWEWVGVNQRAIVWPPAYATTDIKKLPIAV